MMGANDTFTIDELARAAGMTPRNVRAYRTKGLLPPPDREGRASRYRSAHLHRLRDIHGLREAGLPLKMIIDAALRGDDLGPSGPLWRLSRAGPVVEIDVTDGAGPPGHPGAAELSARVIDLASDGMSPHGVSVAGASAGIERASYHVTLAVTALAEALCADLGGTVQDLPPPVLGATEQVVVELVREAVADLAR